MKKKKILITGGKGFIGSGLTKRLTKAGYAVSVFDLPENDICNFNQLDRAIKGKDIVYHLAAVADLNWAKDHPQETFNINIVGTDNVARACVKHGALLNFTSTCCVYGNQEVHPSSEKVCPNPTEIYACSKMAGEYIVRGYERLYGLKYNIMRIATTYGPGMRPALAVYIFLDKALKGEKILIHGNGKQTRTLTYIDDEIEGMARVVEAKLGNEVINISTEEELPVLEHARRALRICGRSEKDIVFGQDRPGQIYKEEIDTSKAKKLMEWKAKISFDEGLKRTFKWMADVKNEKSNNRRR